MSNFSFSLRAFKRLVLHTCKNKGLFRKGLIEGIYRQQNKCDLVIEICLGRVVKIVGNGENAGFRHVLFFPQCFQKASCSRSLKSRDCVVKGLQLHIQTFIDHMTSDGI